MDLDQAPEQQQERTRPAPPDTTASSESALVPGQDMSLPGPRRDDGGNPVLASVTDSSFDAAAGSFEGDSSGDASWNWLKNKL